MMSFIKKCILPVFALFSLIAFFSSNAAAQSSSIFPVTPTHTITSPSSDYGAFAGNGILGDFDGDGKPDLAYTSGINSQAGNYLYLLSNVNAPPSAPSGTSLTCSPNSTPLAAGDLDNDGNLDAVVTCSNALVVLLGHGDGTFKTPIYYTLSPLSVPVLLDLNGDGYLDIAVVSANGVDGVAVLLNHGSSAPGTFSAPPNNGAPGSGSYSKGFASGDFNGDGKQDLLVTSNPGYLGLYYGNGDGTLQTLRLQAIPGYQPSLGVVGIGDFNHDGATDIAYLTGIATSSSTPVYSSIQIMLGSTSGTLSQGVSVPITSTGYISGLVAAALTNNGHLDLIASGSATTIFHGDGEGNFAPTGTYAASGTPLIADINGDGKPDVFLGFSGAFFTLFGNGDATLQAIPTTPINNLIAVTPTDINGDGLSDAVFLTQSNNATGPFNLGTALGNGDGTFTVSSQSIQLPTTSADTLNTFSLVQGDFNGDGKSDVVAVQSGSAGCHGGDASNGELFPYLGTGAGSFQAAPSTLNLGSVEIEAEVTGDFNGDGKLDLMISTNNPCVQSGSNLSLLFLAGKGDGTFSSPVNISTAFGNGTNLLAGDLNHDGKLDLIWSDSNNNNSNAAYLGNGDGTFQEVPLSASLAGATLFALGDVNGDNYPDLLVSSTSTYGPGVYAGNGDGTFQTSPFYLLPVPQTTRVYSALVGDVNADGNRDTIWKYQFMTSGSAVQVSSNTDASFSGNVTPFASPIALARLNNQAPALPNDHALDILTVSSDGLTSLLNQKNPPPSKPTLSSTTTTLQASATSANVSSEITLTATVTGISPTGSVSFTAGEKILGTADLASNGTATLQTSFANIGNYSITASYQGNSNNTPSTSNAVTITITPAQTTTRLQASPVSVSVNTQITLTATVTGDNPTGTVSFASGSTSLGTATLTNGTATLQTSFANAGNYSITASYQGDSNNAASTSNTVTIAVATAQSSTALHTSTTSASVNAQITLTATVTGDKPTGSVAFMAQGSILGSALLTNGTATLQTSFANAGNYSITASYQGDSNNAASTSSAATITITPLQSTTTLQASSTSANLNAPLTLTATVAGDNPTGSVSFASGSTSLGTATLTNGTATLQTSFANAGSYPITASYQGDGNNTPSTSNTVTVSVITPSFTISADPTSATIKPGQSATFALTVTPAGGYAGTIKFACGSLPREATCSFSPATVTPANGPATSTLTITTTAATAKLEAVPGRPKTPWNSTDTFVLAGALGFLLTPKRTQRWKYFVRSASLLFLLVAGCLSFTGCGGTPLGTDQITVTASDSAGGSQSSVTISLMIQ